MSGSPNPLERIERLEKVVLAFLTGKVTGPLSSEVAGIDEALRIIEAGVTAKIEETTPPPAPGQSVPPGQNLPTTEPGKTEPEPGQ